MKIKVIILFFLTAFVKLNGQNIDLKETNFKANVDFKESFISSKSDQRIISREIFLGYKFFNSIVFEFGALDYYNIDKKTDDIEHLDCYGLGVRYQYLYKNNFIKNKFVLEPYIKVNYSMYNSDFYIFYDLGLNIVDANAPFYCFGTGLRHNLTYMNEIAWYLSFGVRF